jgi:hypothetical protein
LEITNHIGAIAYVIIAFFTGKYTKKGIVYRKRENENMNMP